MESIRVRLDWQCVFEIAIEWSLFVDCTSCDSPFGVDLAHNQAKNRGEMAGRKGKMGKQKGSGRARVGNRRTPIRKGGGTAFPPKPRDFSYTLNKKVRQCWLESPDRILICVGPPIGSEVCFVLQVCPE